MNPSSAINRQAAPTSPAPGVRCPVLVVGRWRHGEFRGAVDWLSTHAHVSFADDVAAALDHLARGSSTPPLIVAAQARPGDLPPDTVERLHRAAPLARLVSLLGSLCEGEMRTGRPWPGVLRVYWHQWQARCEAEWLPLLRGECSSWSLPRTATAVEEALHVRCRPLPRRAGLVAIRSARLVEYEALAEVCEQLGTAAVWLPPERPVAARNVDLLVWDSDGRARHELDRLETLVERMRPKHVLALLGFPRRREVERALAAGADRVLSKPHLLGDLVASLERLLPPAQTASAAPPAA